MGTGPSERARQVMRRAFRVGNRAVMLPALRHDWLARWGGSPLMGYFLVLTTTGRRTGMPRQTPLNYAILDGRVYLLAGFGGSSDWLRNLTAHREVSLRMPGRVVVGTAERVTDSAEAERAAVTVARNAGFALVFEGRNPLGITDAELARQLRGRPVVRVVADDPIEPGPHDPGAWWWLLPHVVLPLAGGVAWAAARACGRARSAEGQVGGSKSPASPTG